MGAKTHLLHSRGQGPVPGLSVRVVGASSVWRSRVLALGHVHQDTVFMRRGILKNWMQRQVPLQKGTFRNTCGSDQEGYWGGGSCPLKQICEKTLHTTQPSPKGPGCWQKPRCAGATAALSLLRRVTDACAFSGATGSTSKRSSRRQLAPMAGNFHEQGAARPGVNLPSGT